MAFRVPGVAYSFVGKHHVRFIRADVPLHVFSRITQGYCFLRPSQELNTMIAGVVGRAQHLYKDVTLYAMAFLSNHAHWMLQGPPHQVPAFLGYIKREISRRWTGRTEARWSGSIWHEYQYAALPTADGQVACLKYILSQGVKEGLVRRPEEWPGVHCASALAHGIPLQGTWVNKTEYSRALDSQKRTEGAPGVRKRDYAFTYEVQFARIGPWKHLDPVAYRCEVKRLIDAIVSEAVTERSGKPALGRRKICRTSLRHKIQLVEVPWRQRGRRVICCWASPNDPATREYVSDYREYQRAFREASYRDAQERVPSFPPGSYAPGRWTPAPDQHQRVC